MATALRTARSARAQRRVAPGSRFGGPRRPGSSGSGEPTQSVAGFSPFVTDAGSHMPLDVGIHWHWRNPLNVMPAILLLLTVCALVSLAL